MVYSYWERKIGCKFLKLVKIQSIRQSYSDIVEMQHCCMT